MFKEAEISRKRRSEMLIMLIMAVIIKASLLPQKVGFLSPVFSGFCNDKVDVMSPFSNILIVLPLIIVIILSSHISHELPNLILYICFMPPWSLLLDWSLPSHLSKPQYSFLFKSAVFSFLFWLLCGVCESLCYLW